MLESEERGPLAQAKAVRIVMHITLESDYAVRIVVFLAQEQKRVDANTIKSNKL